MINRMSDRILPVIYNSFLSSESKEQRAILLAFFTTPCMFFVFPVLPVLRVLHVHLPLPSSRPSTNTPILHHRCQPPFNSNHQHSISIPSYAAPLPSISMEAAICHAAVCHMSRSSTKPQISRALTPASTLHSTSSFSALTIQPSSYRSADNDSPPP